MTHAYWNHINKIDKWNKCVYNPKWVYKNTLEIALKSYLKYLKKYLLNDFVMVGNDY